MGGHELHLYVHSCSQHGRRALLSLHRLRGARDVSAAEACAAAEAMVATARANMGWKPVIDALTDLPAGRVWEYDFVRGVDRMEVRGPDGGLVSAALVVAGPQLVWMPTTGLNAQAMLTMAERAFDRAADARDAGDERRYLRYWRVGKRLTTRAVMLALAGHGQGSGLMLSGGEQPAPGGHSATHHTTAELRSGAAGLEGAEAC